MPTQCLMPGQQPLIHSQWLQITPWNVSIAMGCLPHPERKPCKAVCFRPTQKTLKYQACFSGLIPR
jgi:hypothetical protein